MVVTDSEILNEGFLNDLFICYLLMNYLINNFNQFNLFTFLIFVQSIKFMGDIGLIKNYYLTKLMAMDVDMVLLLILFLREMMVENIYLLYSESLIKKTCLLIP